MKMDTDQNGMFLEDIGEIVMSRGGKDIWLVKGITRHNAFRDRDLPDRIYVVDFPGRGSGEEFLLSRQACGAEKFLMIKEVGHEMMRLFERMFDGKVAQFVILWGGRPLDLLDANPPLQRSGLLDTTYIKLTRIEDKTRGFMVRQLRRFSWLEYRGKFFCGRMVAGRYLDHHGRMHRFRPDPNLFC